MTVRSPADVATDLAATSQRRLEAIQRLDWSAVTEADERLAALRTEWERLAHARPAPTTAEWQLAAPHLQAAATAAAAATAWMQDAMQQIESDLAAMPLQRQRLAAYLRSGGPPR